MHFDPVIPVLRIVLVKIVPHVRRAKQVLLLSERFLEGACSLHSHLTGWETQWACLAFWGSEQVKSFIWTYCPSKENWYYIMVLYIHMCTYVYENSKGTV